MIKNIITWIKNLFGIYKESDIEYEINLIEASQPFDAEVELMWELKKYLSDKIKELHGE
jgi:hypothetical protein